MPENSEIKFIEVDLANYLSIANLKKCEIEMEEFKFKIKSKLEEQEKKLAIISSKKNSFDHEKHNISPQIHVKFNEKPVFSNQ